MKVALYYPWIYLTSGAERIILELSRRSRHDFVLFTKRYQPEQTFPGLQNQRIVALDKVPIKRNVGSVAMAAWKILTQRIPLEDFDLLVVVCEGLGDLILFRNDSKPALCICLTPLRPVFDPVYRSHVISRSSFLQKLLLKSASACFRRVDRPAWRRYSRIFCISEEVRRRVLEGGLAGPEKLEVLHPGLGIESQAISGWFKHFFLIPGRVMWTKNIELGIRALERFREVNPEFAEFRLIIAGAVDEKSQPYYRKLQQEAASIGNVQFRIFPSDEEMAALYRDCYAVLFTAFNEDWGIVPLEALTFGKPVIAVNSGGPRETIAHGRCGFLEDPEPEAFAKRMAELVRDPVMATRMGQVGRIRAKKYSWDTFTSRIDQEIDTLGAKVPGRAQFGESVALESCPQESLR